MVRRFRVESVALCGALPVTTAGRRGRSHPRHICCWLRPKSERDRCCPEVEEFLELFHDCHGIPSTRLAASAGQRSQKLAAKRVTLLPCGEGRTDPRSAPLRKTTARLAAAPGCGRPAEERECPLAAGR